MAQVLQLRRGTTAQNDAFTGAIAEVSVDTDRDSLRVHDGTTMGGKEIAPLNVAIPLLADATTVNLADELVVQQGGITKRATVQELANSIPPQLPDATTVNAADELIIQQGGVTKRATAAELFSSSAINEGIKNQLGLNVVGNNQEFSQNNAIVHRLPDKVFVGGAAVHDNNFPAITKDWQGEYASTLSILRVVGNAASSSTTSGSAVVTFTAGGLTPVAGNYISGNGIPDGAKILSVDSATQITLDTNATATTSGGTLWSYSSSDKYPGTAFGNVRSLTNTSGGNTCAGFFAAQSANFTTSGASCLPLYSYALNNRSTSSAGAWGAYIEAFRLASHNAAARGIEVDVVSTIAGSEIKPTPFQQTSTSCLQLAAGAGLAHELPSGVQKNVGAAIQILRNPTRFRVGINFLSDSLEGTDGYSGIGAAIRFSGGHALEWFNPSQDLVGRIYAVTGLTSAQKSEIRFNSVGVVLFGGNNQIIGSFDNSSTSVNYVGFSPADASASPVVSSLGADTNIDLRLNPKGTGVLRYGTHAAVTTETVTGFITIKDAAGNTRKLAVVS